MVNNDPVLTMTYLTARSTLVAYAFEWENLLKSHLMGKLAAIDLNRRFVGFLAHLSRRLRSELIVYRSSRRPSVRPSVCVSTLSNMNISETNGSIATKFYLKHHWGGGLAALGFGPDRIRTLVSMAAESSHRVKMVKTVSPLFLGCFSSDPFHTCR